MEFYKLSKKEVLSNLSTSEAGLSSKEAERRLLSYGLNVIKEKKRISALKIFFSQFKKFGMQTMKLVSIGRCAFIGPFAIDVRTRSDDQPEPFLACQFQKAF